MGTLEAAQTWRQHVGVADALTGGGCWPRHFDAAQGIPHAVALDRFPDAVQSVPRGIAQLFHRSDPRDAQALLHTAADTSDVFELEAVQDFRQIVEVERHQAVGLFELAGKLGEEAIGSEADRGADMGPDVGFERGFDLEGLGARDFAGGCQWGGRRPNISSIESTAST